MKKLGKDYEKGKSKKNIFLNIISASHSYFFTWIIVAQPTSTKNFPSNLTLESSRLKAHVLKLSEAYFPRSHINTENLDRCVEYILAHFKKAGADTSKQEFTVHRNYWQYGYDAVMISDSAFYRNQEYHEPGDTAERLNYESMGKAVIQVFETIKGLANEE